MRTLRPARSDRGSAAADFALVSGLLVLAFLAVLQLAVSLHVRNTLVASAAEGARLAAAADRGLDDGVRRTRDLVTSSLSAGYATDVRAWYADSGGLRTVVVQVRAPLPLVGLLGPADDLTLTGHALVEAP
ncbi:MAG: TadE/TadG family type IV pilus assembly protein [Actinomycetes bacterium]